MEEKEQVEALDEIDLKESIDEELTHESMSRCPAGYCKKDS